MKFAVQENLIPGDSFQKKVENLAEFGYEGVELRGDGLSKRVHEIKQALEDSPIEATCICGGFKFGLLYPDKKDREQSKQEIKELLSVAGEVGASDGVIVVPIFGPAKLPDLSPWKTAVELEETLLVEQLHELAEYAGEQGTRVILEPLNRYETHLINRLEQAVSVCKQVHSPHLTILADFFHMSIEEANISQAIEANGDHIGYVHLADSNRVVPGQGHTNFREGFEALKKVDYRGWMSLECSVPGNSSDTLMESLAFMKKQLYQILEAD